MPTALHGSLESNPRLPKHQLVFSPTELSPPAKRSGLDKSVRAPFYNDMKICIGFATNQTDRNAIYVSEPSTRTQITLPAFKRAICPPRLHSASRSPPESLAPRPPPAALWQTIDLRQDIVIGTSFHHSYSSSNLPNSHFICIHNKASPKIDLDTFTSTITKYEFDRFIN